MQYVQDNPETFLKSVIAELSNGSFEYEMDAGAKFKVAVCIELVTACGNVEILPRYFEIEVESADAVKLKVPREVDMDKKLFLYWSK